MAKECKLNAEPVGTGIKEPGLAWTEESTDEGRSRKRFCAIPEYWGDALKDELYDERTSRKADD